jgi:formylglycine-generating enzyme required for sulfatase activity
MADVFISYKRERRAAARHLANILERYGYSVWFDLALIRGQDYEDQIARELRAAKVVVVLWCTKSVASAGVRSESARAKEAGKLVPLLIETCELPLFSTLEQNIDLRSVTAAPSNLFELAPLLDDVERLVGRGPMPDVKALREYEATWRSLGGLAFAKLPLEDVPIPEAVIGGTDVSPPSPPANDYAFWKGEWDAHRSGEDLAELRAIAVHAPAYFADKAKARIAEIEALEAQRRAEAAREAEIARFRAEGRLEVVVRDGAGTACVWPKPGAGEVFRDVVDVNGHRILGPEMAVVPAGSFMMGSKNDEGKANEQPQHKVTIAQPIAVGRYAVTFDEWDAALAADGVMYEPSDNSWGRVRRPVINVSWADGQAYCSWLSNVTGQAYRLLSEAEWEYACRADTTTAFNFGETISTDQANYNGNSTFGLGAKTGAYRRRTVEVGSLNAPNYWGLHDMHGNVWEWCEDHWHDNYVNAPSDGRPWIEAPANKSRVLRGGAWYNDPQLLRSAFRLRNEPDIRNYFYGFRVARSVGR